MATGTERSEHAPTAGGRAVSDVAASPLVVWRMRRNCSVVYIADNGAGFAPTWVGRVLIKRVRTNPLGSVP